MICQFLPGVSQKMEMLKCFVLTFQKQNILIVHFEVTVSL